VCDEFVVFFVVNVVRIGKRGETESCVGLDKIIGRNTRIKQWLTCTLTIREILFHSDG
jgi:hypothetical protein